MDGTTMGEGASLSASGVKTVEGNHSVGKAQQLWLVPSQR